MQLENRVAIITGAGRGIGQAIALAYAKEGAQLALAARTLSELEETAQQAEALGAEVLVIPADLADPAQVDEMVWRTVDQHHYRYSREQRWDSRASWSPSGCRRLLLDAHLPGECFWCGSLLSSRASRDAPTEPGQNH
jgi:NAD(P)-dependent dehydrogenase (short-subunit alcohol dehydrogenase family)